jgi:heat shock protein HslJ
MKRRAFLMMGLAGGSMLLAPGLLRAQEATPTAGAEIAVIRWELQQIASGNRVLTPDDPADYWIQLLPDGKVLLKADCNQGSGTYTLDGSSLTFSELVTTRVACGEESISDRFVSSLGYTVSFQVTGDGSDQLVLQMMADGGSLTFQPALTGVVWEWVEFEGGDGSRVVAVDPRRYTLEFLDDGAVEVQADCNGGSGEAKVDGAMIELSVATTLIGCPDDSQASDFLRYLDEANTFVIKDGMLALALPADAGIALFRPTAPALAPATPEASATG